MTDNASLSEQLKRGYRQFAREHGLRPRAVRLPAAEKIEFFEQGDTVVICMKGDAVVANMQTNEAAFEGWALVLRVWLGRRVALEWQTPSLTKPEQRLHYQRFLYRVHRFEKLFSNDWFSVQPGSDAARCEALTSNDLFLNMAQARPLKEVAAELFERTPGGDAPIKKFNREARLEHTLWHDAEFAEQLGLKIVDRQFPVGLYKTAKASKASAIFSGQKSAIDLVGYDGRTLWLFELKAGANLSVGTLSETMFYASVLHEAAGVKPRFRFPDQEPKKGNYVHGKHVGGCEAIKAVMITEQPHPLLEHPELLSTLNAAADGWNVDGAVPVQFSAHRIENFEVDGKKLAFHPPLRTEP